MHLSAMYFGQQFFNSYGKGKKLDILDIGSLNVNGSLREVAPKDCNYTGVDYESGDGVDIVMQAVDGGRLPFRDNSFDLIVSSSAFEHAPHFWEDILEMSRVLKPGGFIYINAPSNGEYHRYPNDNWRFYPDAGLMLERWLQKNNLSIVLVESFVGEKMHDIWNDFVAVFAKLEYEDIYNNLDIIELISNKSDYAFNIFNYKNKDFPIKYNPNITNHDVTLYNFMKKANKINKKLKNYRMLWYSKLILRIKKRFLKRKAYARAAEMMGIAKHFD